MSRDDHRPETARALVDSVEGVPVLVRDRHLTVVASNALARALSPGFVEGTNLARYTFVDSAGYAGAACWDVLAGQVAAMLRESLDHHHEDAPFRHLVGELSATSATFSAAWADEKAPARQGVARFLGTPVGDMTLAYREEWIDDTQADALMMLAGVDAESEARLARLASIVANGRIAE